MSKWERKGSVVVFDSRLRVQDSPASLRRGP